jgi:hypothetical protein
MQRPRKILKLTLLTTLGLAVAMVALSLFFHARQQRLMGESPFIQQLTKAEQHGDYAALTRSLVEHARTVTKAESRLVTAWLKRREHDSRFPVLHLLSLYYFQQGRMSPSAEWFSAAALVGRVDVACCNDPTAGQALTVIEMLHGPLKQRLAGDPEEKARAARWALDYEERNKSRPVAAWISSHGINAFSGGATPLPDADRAKARARIREEFASVMSQVHAKRGN